MTNVITHGDGNRGPSPNLWRGNAPLNGQYWNDPNKGWGFFDDFLEVFATANRYTIVEAGSSGSFGMLTTEVGGVGRLVTGTSDNDEASIGPGTDAGVFKINAGTGELFFEARIRTSTIGDNGCALFVGLAEEGTSAANILTDNTGVIADKDCVGFQIVSADGNAVTAVHNTAGGGGVTTAISSVLVPVASTWYKLGLHFDGTSKVSWWVNGVKNATTVLESATNFPDGEELHMLLAAKVGTAASQNIDIDWWACCQEAV